MSKPIKVLLRIAGKEPSVETIGNDLPALRRAIGGGPETPFDGYLSKQGIQIVCNRDGKNIPGLKPNVYIGDYDVVFGDIIFVGAQDDEFVSLTPEQIGLAKEYIAGNDASAVKAHYVDSYGFRELPGFTADKSAFKYKPAVQEANAITDSEADADDETESGGGNDNGGGMEME